MRSEPKFYLKSNKATKKTPIILNLKVLKENFRYSIQKSIEPELWDRTTQRPTKEKKLLNEYKKHIPTLKEDLKDIENRITNLDKDTRQFLNLAEQNNEVINLIELKAYLDSKYKTIITNKDVSSKVKLNEYIGYFIEGIESGKILISSGKNFGQKYQPSTVKSWKEWQTQINLFQKHHGKLKWEDIDMNVYEEIINFFYDKNHSINTVGKHLKNLKAILRRGYENAYHKNEIFNNKEFRVLKEEIDKVTLTFEELESLSKLKLENKTLDYHRDIFLIGCYTALRISDITRLKKSHISQGKFIKMRMQKVKDEVIIPISGKLNAILKKYDYNVTNVNIQDFRVNIKTLCKDAKIDDDIEIKSSKGGNIKYLTKPKYKFISSHTARRTGATLMFLSGIKPLLIQRITGHKKEGTLLKYINVSQEQVAQLIATNPYFV